MENPDINWQTGEIQRRKTPLQKPQIEETKDHEEWMNTSVNGSSDQKLDDFNSLVISYIGKEPSETEINVKTSHSQQIIFSHSDNSIEQIIEERIPHKYHPYLDVFDKKAADRMPASTPWDHQIELKTGFEPRSPKLYNLTPEERQQQEEFIRENLKKRYIRPSRSPMVSLFFFMSKKDRKLRPTQDYQYLNNWMIKNVYPLPLISEIMDKIKITGAKYFTKLDV